MLEVPLQTYPAHMAEFRTEVPDWANTEVDTLTATNDPPTVASVVENPQGPHAHLLKTTVY